MSKPLTALPDLNLFEVTLCEWGKNNKKRFPIWKHKERKEEMDDFNEILKSVLETELDEEKELDAWVEKAKLDEKAVNAAKAALRILSGFKDVLPKDVLDKLAGLAGYPAPTAKQDEPKDKDKYPSPMAKSLEGVPKEVREHFETVLKARDEELTALKESNETIAKSLKAEKDARELDAWIKKAEADLAHFPGKSTDEIAKSLKALADVDPKLAEEQFTAMKAASDALKESEILKSKGSSFDGGGAADSAWAAIEKAADGMIEKSGDSTLTRAQAIDLVCKHQPELYTRYVDESEKARR